MNRLWMSTTVCTAPARLTSSRASRSRPVQVLQPFLDDQGLAEDARRLGQRHRQPALQRGAVGELRVVVGVAQLVSSRLRRVDAAVPVEEHQRPVVDERHAERAATLAFARSGVDPLLVDGPIDEAAEWLAVRGERPADDLRAFGPRDASSPRTAVVRRGRTTADAPGRAVQASLGVHPSAEIGQGIVDCRLHRVERRPADVVGEQRCLDRAVPAASSIDDVGLTLHRVHRRGAHHRDGRPGAHLGVVGGLANRRVGVGGETADRSHRQRSRVPSATRPVPVSCEVTSACSALPSARARVGELGVQAFFGLGHLVLGARAPGTSAGRRCSATSVLTDASASTPSELTHSAKRANSGRARDSTTSSSLSRPCAVSSKLSVETVA